MDDHPAISHTVQTDYESQQTTRLGLLDLLLFSENAIIRKSSS